MEDYSSNPESKYPARHQIMRCKEIAFSGWLVMKLNNWVLFLPFDYG
jgi:hypothetical protein